MSIFIFCSYFGVQCIKWGGNLFSWELRKKDAPKHDTMDDFLGGFIEIWVHFKFRVSFLSDKDFCGSMISSNSLVRIANRPF